MKLTDLNEAKYIALETFRKNGAGVVTPVWQIPEGGKLLVWTQPESWKVKRIRNNPRVRVCRSDSRGKPQSDWLEAQAWVLDDPTTITAQRQRMAAKYGLMYKLIGLIGPLMGRSKDGVVIEISSI